MVYIFFDFFVMNILFTEMILLKAFLDCFSPLPI